MIDTRPCDVCLEDTPIADLKTPPAWGANDIELCPKCYLRESIAERQVYPIT